MAERRLQRSQQEEPRNMATAATAGPVPLTKHQFCTHWTGVKCMQANAYPIRAANIPSTSDCPSDN